MVLLLVGTYGVLWGTRPTRHVYQRGKAILLAPIHTACAISLVLLLAIVGCGFDDTQPEQERRGIGDNAKISYVSVETPNGPVSCIVATAAALEARAVSISCDWP